MFINYSNSKYLSLWVITAVARDCNYKLAPSALTGVGLSLDPEGKQKGFWWNSTVELVLNSQGAVIMKIVVLISAHINAQNTKLGH